MSESDAQISTGVVAAASADGIAAIPPTTATTTATLDDAASWAMAGADMPPMAQGFDQVSGDPGSGDWFPSIAATGVMVMALAIEPDVDPLVNLSDGSATAPESGLDDAASQFGFASTGSFPHNAVDDSRVTAFDVLSMPIDHGMPLDHIEWHFNGLLTLV